MKNKLAGLIGYIIVLLATPSLAQDTLSMKYGEDSVTCIMNNSLYYEFFKQWKQSDYQNSAWKDALKPWRWVFLNCPKSTRNIYLHGERIIQEVIVNESDKVRKDKYIDTLMMVYDNRILYFGNEGYVLGKKGSDLYKYRPEAYEESYNILKRSVELEKNESNGPVLIYYFRSAEKMVKAEKAEKSILFDIYDQTSEIIDYNINHSDGKKKTSWENVRGNIELSIEPYAQCPDIIGIYTPKFNNDPYNIDLLNKVTKLLDKKGCTDSELFMEATVNLHKLDPSANTAELLGKMYIKRENYTEAAKYLEEAASLYEDNNDKANAHFLLANVYFQLKRYALSRSECYEVINLRPNDGKAYILIGDLYVSTAKECGTDDLTSKVAFWAAVDKYSKARSVDPSVDELARTKINTFSQYFPVKETLFFYDLSPGDTYTVECWINETTTVRSSD